MDAPIELVPYDSEWPRRFRLEREPLVGVLDPWLVGPVEHIGSTAVANLVAKPVIDIMAGVKSLDASEEAIAAVQTLGYVYAPYRTDVMHWFCKPGPGFRTHHLHLVPYRSKLWDARIAFRDRLRADRALASEYVALKRSLAAQFPHDREAYTEGKTAFVNQAIGKRGKRTVPGWDRPSLG